MEISAKVATYYDEEHPFRQGIGQLRELALKTGLGETYKWNFPTYTLDNKNVLAVCKFKNHFGIWFFKGVFLSDPKNVLENVQKGKTQAMRHWKFKSNDGIDGGAVMAYMLEAIENQKKGMKIVPKKKTVSKVSLPSLLGIALDKDPSLQKAFERLSPYKQKEYAEYISEAKQEKTKASRLGRILPMIIEGVGLNDKYR